MVKTSIARDYTSVFPRVVPNISAWQLFPHLFAVGNESLDCYVVVPESKLQLFTEIISHLDGSRSLATIAAEYLERGRPIDIGGLYESLRRAGLLIGSRRRGELQGLGIPLFEIPVRHPFEMVRSVSAKLFPLLTLLTGIALVAGIVLFAIEPNHWISLGIGRIRVPPVLLYSIAVCGYVLTILWHELCHAIAALRCGLIPSRLSVVAYLALIPLFVLRIPGIYLVPPAQRIRIWAAGIWGSLALAGLAMTAVSLLPMTLPCQQSLARLALANLIVAASNLFPFLPTDGYFIVSTVLRQPNIRARAWKEFKERVRSRRSSNRFLLVYLIISGLAILSLLVLNGFRMYRLARYSTAGFLCAFGLLIFLIVRSRARGRATG